LHLADAATHLCEASDKEHGVIMASVLWELSRFCFSWVIVYLILSFVYSIWTFAEYFNRVLRLDFRSVNFHGALYVAVCGAVRHMARGSAVAIPVGIVSLMASMLLN
jgi:hypothetical protein